MQKGYLRNDLTMSIYGMPVQFPAGHEVRVTEAVASTGMYGVFPDGMDPGFFEKWSIAAVQREIDFSSPSTDAEG